MRYFHSSDSTARLLDTIRSCPPPESVDIKENEKIFHQKTSLKGQGVRCLTLGIWIKTTHISLALTGIKKNIPRPIRWAHVKIPPTLNITHAQFPNFLKDCLDQFTALQKKIDIWAAIDAHDLKLRRIEVPDISEKKIANAAFWAFKREMDVDDTRDIFDFEAMGTVQREGVKKLNILGYSANREKIVFLKELFASIGYPLTGVSALPFAMQNYIRNKIFDHPNAPVGMVHIDKHSSNITCFSQGKILLSRNIKTGSQSLVEDYAQGDDPSELPSSKLFSSMVDPDGVDFDRMRHAIRRLTGKIVATGDYCAHNLTDHQPISQFYFSGDMDQCRAFIAHAQKQIPAGSQLFTPFKTLAHSPEFTMPKTASERRGVIPALGLALSSKNLTPNFLYTHKEKKRAAHLKRLNGILMGLALSCLLLCSGGLGYLHHIENKEAARLQNLEKQIQAFTPKASREKLSLELARANKKADQIRQYTRDYKILALVHDICALTPKTIKLFSVDAHFQPGQAKNSKGAHLTITGMVEDEFNSLESTLTGYIIGLGDAPLFGGATLVKKQLKSQNQTHFLMFTAEMKIL